MSQATKDNMDWLDKWWDDFNVGPLPSRPKADLQSHIEKMVIEAERRAYEFAILGKCPECKRRVQGWEAPNGSFAPEMYATLEEQGINPSTGHKETCLIETNTQKGGE